MRSVLSLRVVVEDHEMIRARQAFFNPTNVVLTKEHLLFFVSPRISPRVAPAIQEIASLFPTPTGMTGGLCGGGAVIDNPDLVEFGCADYDLIEFGVVGNGVHVQ